VQAMVKVPHELPGTSWTEPSGKTYVNSRGELFHGRERVLLGGSSVLMVNPSGRSIHSSEPG
jgi:hypothetical protein